MRFGECPAGNFKEWTVQEWIIDFTKDCSEILRKTTDYIQFCYCPPCYAEMKNWHINRDRAGNIAVSGVMMAMELARELDR